VDADSDKEQSNRIFGDSFPKNGTQNFKQITVVSQLVKGTNDAYHGQGKP